MRFFFPFYTIFSDIRYLLYSIHNCCYFSKEIMSESGNPVWKDRVQSWKDKKKTTKKAPKKAEKAEKAEIPVEQQQMDERE
jgi:cellulose synthase A